MADAPNVWIELVKVSPGLLTALVATGFFIAHADSIGRLLSKATKLKVLDIEIEASVTALNDAIVAQGLDNVVGQRDRMAALRRLSACAPLLRGSRILWVDDKPPNNFKERQLLEGLGVRFDLAAHSAEAEQFLRNHRYLLMLTDIDREDIADEGIRFAARAARLGIHVWTIGYTGTDQTGRSPPLHFFGITNRPDHLMHLICDVAQREGV